MEMFPLFLIIRRRDFFLHKNKLISYPRLRIHFHSFHAVYIGTYYYEYIREILAPWSHKGGKMKKKMNISRYHHSLKLQEIEIDAIVIKEKKFSRWNFKKHSHFSISMTKSRFTTYVANWNWFISLTIHRERKWAWEK